MLHGKALHLKRLTPSQEHYLRAILDLSLDPKGVRVVDLARRLDVSRATVSVALKSLANRRLVKHRPYGRAELTAIGRLCAQQVSNRFAVIRYFLERVLRLHPKNASLDACLMEHVVSGETLDRLTDLVRFLTEDEQAQRLLKRFLKFHRSCGPDPCRICSFRCEVNLGRPRGVVSARPA